MINAININVNFQRGAAPLARPRARIIPGAGACPLDPGSGVPLPGLFISFNLWVRGIYPGLRTGCVKRNPEFGELFTEDLLKINPRAFRAGVD